MKRSYSLTMAIVLIIALLILINLISSQVFKHARVDLTSEKLYTLSEGTGNILDKLEDNLRLKFYITEASIKKLPGIKLYFTRVKEMVEEYVKLSGNKISLTVFDVKPDTEEEELAQQYGLQQVPLQGGEILYMGMVISDESGNDEVISFFNPDREEFLEYDISKAIVNVNNPEKKVVGILSPLPVMGESISQQKGSLYGGNEGNRPWAIVTQLKQLYRVTTIDANTAKIDENVDILMLIHPKDLSPETKLAIDQYLLEGGRIIAFLDPNCETDNPPPNPQNPYESMMYDRSSKAQKLLASWGLSMNSENLAADLNLAVNVRTQSNRLRPYPIYLDIKTAGVNDKEVMAGGIENLIFASAGILEVKDAPNGLEIIPVVQTTAEAGVIKKSPFMQPDTLMKNFVKGSEKLSLAYRVSGKFKTAFPEGIKSGDDILKADITESAEPSSVVVFSDVDFITDRFSAKVVNFLGQRIVQLANDNLNLVFNAVEAMAGSQDLIAVRSRGSFEKPFTKVHEMEKEAQEKWRNKESELQGKVHELEQKLNSLQSRRSDEFRGQVLTAEQMSEIEKFKEERLSYQKKLREVRKNLREEIENLEKILKFANIWFMPLLIVLTAVVLHFVRRKKGGQYE